MEIEKDYSDKFEKNNVRELLLAVISYRRGSIQDDWVGNGSKCSRRSRGMKTEKRLSDLKTKKKLVIWERAISVE